MMKSLEEKPQEPQKEVVREPDPLLTPEVRERQRRAGAMVLKWAKEKDGYDEEIWPLIKEEFGWE